MQTVTKRQNIIIAFTTFAHCTKATQPSCQVEGNVVSRSNLVSGFRALDGPSTTFLFATKSFSHIPSDEEDFLFGVHQWNITKQFSKKTVFHVNNLKVSLYIGVNQGNQYICEENVL